MLNNRFIVNGLVRRLYLHSTRTGIVTITYIKYKH